MTAADPRRVLIVEDDPEIQYLLSVILEEDDREIVAVHTGSEAWEQLERGDVDLVVLDLILPDIDGRTLLATMRQRPETATIPVVVISARGGTEIRRDCYDLGADFFAEKPFDPEELATDIAARLERTADRERISLRDPVTGLLNGAGLLDAGSHEGGAYSLALIQLDGFSSLSERWGWSKAEEVLRDVGPVMQSAIDTEVKAARMGGGEFALLMAAAEVEEAVEICESVLARIRAVQVTDTEGETIRLTASIGVVGVDAETPIEEALEAARRRLFVAREAGRDQVVAQDGGAKTTRARILVAEDDDISATILLHRLEKEGMDVVRFDNGRDAYDHALEETPDLVILDVKMPGMGGFEVLERLRRVSSYSAVPIILLTSMGSEADVVRGFQLGADDYILKPFSPLELSARVWSLLRRGRSASAV